MVWIGEWRERVGLFFGVFWCLIVGHDTCRDPSRLGIGK